MLRVNYFQLVIRYSIIPDCQLLLWCYEEGRRRWIAAIEQVANQVGQVTNAD